MTRLSAGSPDAFSIRIELDLLFLVVFATGAILFAEPHPASAQDTLDVAGTTLAPSDSMEARRLLRTDLGPTSDYWAQRYDSTSRGRAVKAYRRVALVAYQIGSSLDAAETDSVLSFHSAVGNRHPAPSVRAEFLFSGLRIASATDRSQAARRFYRKLTAEHEGSQYAEDARQYFGPDRNVQAGNRLPSFEFPRLSDSTAAYTNSDFEGKVLLIDFWGTWCPPCLKAMPHLHQIYREHRDEGLAVLSVAMKDTREAVREFREEKWEMPWSHAFVPKGSEMQERVRNRFNIAGYPTSILIGRDGEIRRVNFGFDKGDGEELTKATREAIAEAPRKEVSRQEPGEEGNPEEEQ